MNYISDILFWISTGLLVPVVVLLILFFLRSLLLLGNFFGQYLQTRKTDKVFREKIMNLTSETLDDFRKSLPENPKSPLLKTLVLLMDSADSRPRRQLLLSDYEVAADKDMALSKTLSKMGPMLGLMGTLIPMGPALVGLSTGDISSMAYNMQVAFATTVVGLFSAAIGFMTQQVKQRWYTQDLNRLEFVSEVLDGREPR
ncbi:MAG: MotA/TolQ/ExbB proton channel family protein [Muribaculum sp.]|uniref:MotA/TolQ/ExbB proton channel family protein n=1 Tax=Candidatus Merdivivens faecigallinarum TaxID=2840871 RepID=A0A9D9J223_9BACT|nr:MotA/TolQ/ExbB proton channel family protein [Candidatus Merdivivens faecigallinarum]